MRMLIAILLIAASPKQDPRLLKLIERENQVAQLLTAGKLAYDAGDFATAAARWEALLKLDGVPADVERAVKPLLAEARGQRTEVPAEPEKPAPPPKPANVSVLGTI